MELVYVLFFFFICSAGCLPASNWYMTVPDMVTGKLGKDVLLPCNFTPPAQKEQESLTVIWRTKFHYTGPVIFSCLSKTDMSETGQNCSKSHGRYSLLGNPRSNNISLRIKDVTFMDEKTYFCRIQLSKSGSFETLTGTRLNIHVAPELLSIYIQTRASGEQLVTCDVKGSPPPTVMWIMPENISAPSVSVQSTCCSASSSIAYKPNTNYTCQIHGENGLQHQTIYFQAATEPKGQVSWPLFFTFVTLSGVFCIVSVILAVLYIKGLLGIMETTQHSRARDLFQKNEVIYENTNIIRNCI
ncbi:sialic acid-binding Ig-like lectin 15 isoform X1 [Electrophorus electricus]|uniref:sialic acid-binding Ig-like lectin 15 isoform X1 n=2 Tax=Electrophorus electricus TaxID=8005 RepID=UPI0015D0CEEC|nr:sialic acid-binding Ig-like lectin 15 isoform X1 [Electrophorus electricus]XP_035385795.1 sialic acid-binding Ig-like lectin 15 isoform X1 [Electrophorus electricus]XP_035385796.1 sialic acid-binding Ig-like lectin 15 isoform X1 [Electrophorus electricus]